MTAIKRIKFYGLKNLYDIPQLKKIPEDLILNIKVVANVLPFRTNNYVINELINWRNIPEDPIYQLTFMQKEMLQPGQFNKMASLIKNNGSTEEIKTLANEIRFELNPHPSGQMTANVPQLDGEPVQGIQHKYKETVLVFPSSGQTCHAYCTFCFRWAQFVGIHDLKFATDESKRFQEYIKQHKEVTDVLFTGGDPMVMSFPKLKAYLEPLLSPEFEHIRNIRIGTKSLSFWPYRYVTDKDSDDILRLFDKLMCSGKHLAFMGHFNHYVELETEILKKAVRRLRNVGVKVRTQAPVVKHINDSADVWVKMWKEQVNLGIIPYYMFIERNTGAKRYFELPISQVFKIYREAIQNVSGLSRTARGPVMSATPGKVLVDGIAEINNEKVFILNFLQARNPEWICRPFFAEYDENATWFDQLKPAFKEEKFFFEDEFSQMINTKPTLPAHFAS